MNRSEILGTAKSHITKDRAATHGNAENGFALIGALWSADLGIPINATDVARLMVLFKAARAKANPKHADNWIDAAGYAACGGEIATQALPNENRPFDEVKAEHDASRPPLTQAQADAVWHASQQGGVAPEFPVKQGGGE